MSLAYESTFRTRRESPNLTEAARESYDVRGDVIQFPLAIPASETQGILGPDSELCLDRLSLVRDAIGIATSEDPHIFVGKGHSPFLRDVVVPDHVYRRVGGYERYLVHFPGAQLPVLDLYYVLPTEHLARHVHRYRDRGGDVLTYAEDLEDLERHSTGDMIDDGPVLDGGYADLLQVSAPKTIERSAMRIGMPLKACLKYLAWDVESTSGDISVTRGSGWRIMRSLRASFNKFMSTR